MSVTDVNSIDLLDCCGIQPLTKDVIMWGTWDFPTGYYCRRCGTSTRMYKSAKTAKKKWNELLKQSNALG